MKSTLLKITISFLLGCITFYIFVCFTGVVMAFLLDSGIDSFFIHNFIKTISMLELKKLIYFAYMDSQKILVNFMVVFLFTYFFSKYLVKNIFISALILTLGAITTDLFIFPRTPYNLSYFFTEGHMIDLYNLLSWYVCAVISIKLMYVLKSKIINKNAQPSSTPDGLNAASSC